MNQFDTSFSARFRDGTQSEPLYCSTLQRPGDIICEGSDSEQTAEEIQQKRQRYEASARRFMGGRRPFMQSASLRGPLDRQSGWVNPWRHKPLKSEDWWQPGSEDMLFTKENVMKRAADHGLGYLTPNDALAWCKAAAETEAWRDLDQWGSIQADRSEGSDVDMEEDMFNNQHSDPNHEEEPGNSNHTSVGIAATRRTERKNFSESFGNNAKVTKRPAASEWLKGSYVSKRARWNDTPLSSPTPLPNESSERDWRHRRNTTSYHRLDNEESITISQPTTPWIHEAQRRGTRSTYISAAQPIVQRASGRDVRNRKEDVDWFQDDLEETTFVPSPYFLSGSQQKARNSRPINPNSDVGSDHSMTPSNMDLPANSPAATVGNALSRKPGLNSCTLPELAQSSANAFNIKSVAGESFVTEVAPSSRNLEKFQFRKKRRKSRIQLSGEDREEPQLLRQNPTTTLPPQAPIDYFGDTPSQSLFPTNLPHNSPLEVPDAEQSNLPPSSGRIHRLGSASKPSSSVEREPHVNMPVRGSSELDDSYVRKLVMMPENGLLNIEVDSPFAPFESMAFGPFSTSNATPRPVVLPAGVSGDAQEVDSPTPSLAASPMGRPVMPSSQDANKSLAPVTTSVEIDILTMDAPCLTDNSISPPLSLNVDAEAPSKRSSQSINTDIKPQSRKDIQAAQSTPTCDAAPPTSSLPQVGERLGDTVLSTDVLGSPEKSRPTAKSIERVRTNTKHFDEDITQSFNTTPPESTRKCCLFPIIDASPGKNERQQSSAKLQPPPEEGPQIASANSVPANSAIFEFDQVTEVAGLLDDPAQDAMENTGDTMPENLVNSPLNGSRQIHDIASSQPSLSAANSELELGRLSPLAPKEEEAAPVVDKEEDSCPQSPWAVEIALPKPLPNTDQYRESFVFADRETTPFTRGSPSSPSSAITSDWQTIEHTLIPNDIAVLPFRLSPSRALGEPPEQDMASNTQRLIEVATSNPWYSTTKKRASQIPKKRVSFGGVQSEEDAESQLETLSSSRKRPASPPPSEYPSLSDNEDTFADSPIAVGAFGKHFAAAGGALRHLVDFGSQTFKSPAVGAMADRFIAADRETSTELERQAEMAESPTRHLKPKSDAGTNQSPSMATDHDVELDLDEFINDAAEFLEDWTVDSEVKKATSRRESSSGSSGRRSLFGLRNVWAS